MSGLRGPDSSKDAQLLDNAVFPETVDVNIRQLDPFPAPRYFLKEIPLTDGGAWLFEIHAHHNDQLVFQFFFDRGEFCRVFVRRFRIMNRAWADDGKQTIVFAVEHIADFLTGLQHQIAHLIGEWNFLQKISGSRNRVQIVRRMRSCWITPCFRRPWMSIFDSWTRFRLPDIF